MSASVTDFNPNFYHPREKWMIGNCQLNRGCFYCHKPGALKTCSACKFAVYCNRDCQKAHWKHDSTQGFIPHIDMCKQTTQWLRRDFARPLPMHLPALGFSISEEDIDAEMVTYSDMFMDELVKAGIPGVNLQVFCLHDGENIVRFNATASFFSGGRVQLVNYVIFSKVDTGPDAARMIDEMGTVSAEAKERICALMMDFAQRLHNKGLKITSITRGTGLYWLDEHW